MIAIDPIDFIADENRETILKSAKEQNIPLEVLALRFLNEYYTLRVIENVDKEKVKQQLDAKLTVNTPTVTKAAPVETSTEEDETPTAVGLDTPLSDINFGKGVRTGPLEKAGINTLGELLARDETTLSDIPRFGQGSIDAITEWCWENNFDFAPSIKEVDIEAESSDGALEGEEVEFDFDSLPSTLEGIKAAGAEYARVYELEGDEARPLLNKICTSAGLDTDNIEGTARQVIVAIRDSLPATGDQYARVVALGDELGETEQHVTVTRPEALSGKSLAKMTRMEANTLIEELENENSEVGDDVF